MNAVIVHQVKVLDPRTLPDYLRELERYVRATDPTVHGTKLIVDGKPALPRYGDTKLLRVSSELFFPEGPKPAGASPAYSDLVTEEEYAKIVRAAALGKTLYLHALELLEKLNILGIYNLKDLSKNHTIKDTFNLIDLKDGLELICSVPISFSAKIDPPVPMGTNRIDIEVDLWADVAVYRGMNGNLWDFKSPNPRAIKISSRFIDPRQAVVGLSGLLDIFPDARFEERLILSGLPGNVARMYRQIAEFREAFQQACVNYISGLRGQEPDFDEKKHREMASQAGISHLAFLEPIFKRLGIHPHSIHYHDDKLNLFYDITVGSLDEVAGLISRGYYNGMSLPVIHAAFNGRKVIIEFPLGYYGARIPVAMQVTNGSEKGTLESILSGINSIKAIKSH